MAGLLRNRVLIAVEGEAILYPEERPGHLRLRQYR